MNFKLTLQKTIISVIIGLIGGYLIPNGCIGSCPPNSKLYMFLIFTFIFAIIIYLIWSFIQKKS